jgi:hypothetical protein
MADGKRSDEGEEFLVLGLEALLGTGNLELKTANGARS